MGKIFSIWKKGYAFGDKPFYTAVRGMEVAGIRGMWSNRTGSYRECEHDRSGGRSG